MTNPFNPLDWLKSAQDWFARSERSSGFRPYLVYIMLAFGMATVLLMFFSHLEHVQYFALGVIGVSCFWFMVLFSIKAFEDPNFCRSEVHVQKVMKIELERLGSESSQIEGEIVERALLTEAVKDTVGIEESPKGGSSK